MHLFQVLPFRDGGQERLLAEGLRSSLNMSEDSV